MPTVAGTGLLELSPRPAGAETGDSQVSLEGSGVAFPPGLETVWEYNNMLFNKLDTIDKIRVMKVDGLYDADIRDNRELNPDTDGETALDAFYGGRTIVFTGRIEAYRLEKLRDMQQAFRQAFADVRTEYPLIFHAYGFISDGQGGWKRGPSIYRTGQINCRKVQPITMTEEQNDFRFYRDFMLTLRASDPRFVSYLTNFIQWQPSAGGSVTDVTIASPNNIGNYIASPVITLFGPMTNPVITNLRTGEVFRLTAVIPAAAKWTIDEDAKTILDQTGASQFQTLTIDSVIFDLQPGLNTITLSATGLTTASQVTFSYKDSWL